MITAPVVKDAAGAQTTWNLKRHDLPLLAISPRREDDKRASAVLRLTPVVARARVLEVEALSYVVEIEIEHASKLKCGSVIEPVDDL